MTFRVKFKSSTGVPLYLGLLNSLVDFSHAQPFGSWAAANHAGKLRLFNNDNLDSYEIEPAEYNDIAAEWCRAEEIAEQAEERQQRATCQIMGRCDRAAGRHLIHEFFSFGTTRESIALRAAEIMLEAGTLVVFRLSDTLTGNPMLIACTSMKHGRMYRDMGADVWINSSDELHEKLGGF